MSPTRCARLFEAEAMRDGRLVGAELASFARHLTTCPACAHEARALEALATGLRAAPVVAADVDELRVLRARTRLMAAFDRTLVAPEPRSRVPRWLWPAAVAALAAGLLVFGRARPPAPAVRTPSVVVQADRTAVYSEHAEGDRKRLVLARGAIWVHVDHPSGQGHLVVELPDGELEDRGTTFTVSVEAGHTTRVAVQEGSVALSLKGERTVTIGAGDTWTPELRRASPDQRPAPLSVDAPAPAPLPAPPRRAPTRPRLASSPRPVVTATPAPADAMLDFRAAVALLDAGANRRAAAAFASFTEAHARDPRAEDAAYLLVIALQRSGADQDMKRAAQQYLKRYPAGFRRNEVERLESRRP